MSPLDNLATFTFYIGYLFAMLGQITVQCHFASLATAESEDTLRALFAGNWLETDLRNRKLLCMFMVRLREPSRIKTMQSIVIDRRIFMSILNMSYSLFAVLRKTSQAKN